MSKKFTSGFTLLELMVVILVMGILAAVSGPIYSSYTVKSRFAEAFGTMNQYRNDLANAYQDQDRFPDSFFDITVNTYNELSSPVLQQVYYGIATDGSGAYLQFFTLDLGVDDYVQASNLGSDGVNCRITVAAIPNDTGQTQFYCGQWDGSEMDVPLTYLPEGCQDTDISDLIN